MTTTDPGIIDTEATESTDEEEHEVAHVGELVEHAEITPVDLVPGHIAGSDLTVIPLPNELDLLAQMAVTIAAASTAPKALQGKPNDVFMILLTARDLGVALTTAIREFHVIDGKVTLSPKVRKAMVNQRGIGQVWADPGNNAETATWYGIRGDLPGITNVSTYTMEMAKRVGNGKLVGKDNWTAYPERMLSWRALGYLMDDVFSEVGTGLYSPDELGAVTDEDGVPVIDVVAHAEPLRGTKAPTGHNAPPPELLSDDDRQALQDRIDRLTRHSTEARAALLAMWTEDDQGTPRLPPMRHVLARQHTVAKALVASIEARAKKGEWGEWHDEPANDAPEGAPDAPGAAPDPIAAPVVPTPAEPDAGPVMPPPPPGAPTPAAAIADGDMDEIEVMATEVVAALSNDDLTTMLTERGLALGGSPKQRRARLVKSIVKEERAAQETPAESSTAVALPGTR